MKLPDVVRLTVLAMLWGGSFLFMRIAAPIVGPAWVAFGRSGIAAVLLLVYAAVTRSDLHFKHYWKQYVVLGALQSALPFFLFAYAETSLSASLGAILNATTPLFGLLIGVGLGDERLKWDNAFGVLLGITGVGIVVGLDGAGITSSTIIPVLLAAGAACSYGVSSNYTRRNVRGAPSLGMATYSQTFAALMLSPLLMLFPPLEPVTVNPVVALVLLGVLSTGLAYILFFRLVIDVGPVNASTVTFLVPITALIWGVVLLHEQVNHIQLIGSAIVLLGTALTTGAFRPFAKQQTT